MPKKDQTLCTVLVPEKLRDQLKRFCEQTGRKMGAFAAKAIRNEMARERKKK
jgi:hypothetical protein